MGRPVAPTRDLLHFAPAGDAAGVDFLEFVRSDALANGTHQLSERTYRWTAAGGLQVAQ